MFTMSVFAAIVRKQHEDGIIAVMNIYEHIWSKSDGGRSVSTVSLASVLNEFTSYVDSGSIKAIPGLAAASQ